MPLVPVLIALGLVGGSYYWFIVKPHHPTLPPPGAFPPGDGPPPGDGAAYLTPSGSVLFAPPGTTSSISPNGQVLVTRPVTAQRVNPSAPKAPAPVAAVKQVIVVAPESPYAKFLATHGAPAGPTPVPAGPAGRAATIKQAQANQDWVKVATDAAARAVKDGVDVVSSIASGNLPSAKVSADDAKISAAVATTAASHMPGNMVVEGARRVAQEASDKANQAYSVAKTASDAYDTAKSTASDIQSGISSAAAKFSGTLLSGATISEDGTMVVSLAEIQERALAGDPGARAILACMAQG